jgi:hypothetical protein
VASQIPRSQFCGFYLWGNLKWKVYKNNPHSTEALQNELTRLIGSITVHKIQKASHKLFMRWEACLQAAPFIKHSKFVLSCYSILINVCMYRNWCERISDTTALSLAGKGTAVAEKRSIRSTLLPGSLYHWTPCIYVYIYRRICMYVYLTIYVCVCVGVSVCTYEQAPH